ncbi:DUF4097 family beta strand repeat-containing protein [Silanimonas sp.]|jgi:hypothetical protein|uniref:DUF4097 family beta strand repeat-containing protein n=1 Tax=Silanimonas sp. TaxID=1929290 RepID=UPI0022C1B1A3|nr:DUF4097 family beta strand repeat-containing protein [Silanimonas sp.]MCZ8113725.1 DUF4097 family beta strand repeat-containing protein [Silanimonas sp.]
MRAILLPLLLATCVLTLPALASERCEHQRKESPVLDLAGVKRVVISINADTLSLVSGRPALSVTHCASSEREAKESRIEIARRGDTLHVSSRDSKIIEVRGLVSMDIYLSRRIDLSLPPSLPVTLDVSAGNALVSGMEDVSVDLGSGDVHLSTVGAVRANVGSGDLLLENIASIDGLSSGSGDIVVRRVGGDVRGVEVGSGDIAMDGVAGNVAVDDVGSGDVRLHGIAGNVTLGAIGSGNVKLDDVGGDVVVASKDLLENVDIRRVRGRILVDR